MVDFEDNLKLVDYVFYSRFKNYYYCKDDFIQIGRMALWKATKKFDETKGVKFSTFASNLIKNDMLRYAKNEQKYNSRIKDLPDNYVLAYDDKVDLRKFKAVGLTVVEERIMNLFLIGYNYTEIAKIHNCTPQFIHKKIKGLKNKIIFEN